MIPRSARSLLMELSSPGLTGSAGRGIPCFEPHMLAGRTSACNEGEPHVNVLLLSMPDSFEHMASITIRMPNGALTSLAGNLDPHHRVAVADLVLVQSSVRETVRRLVAQIDPDVVGLSVMTFQRATAFRVIELI